MLTQLTQADAEPVSLEDAKAHLRVVHNSDDMMISSLIRAARENVEATTGRALASADYLWSVEHWPTSRMRLPLLPVASVDSVTYLDPDGVRVEMDPAHYEFDDERASLGIPCWRRSVNVKFRADPGEVPASLKAAVLMLVADMYENAEASAVGPAFSENPTFQRLVFPWRVNLGV